MKNSLKIFLLLLTYVLIAVCTFGVVTWMYQVPVPQIEKLDYQLYIGIAAGVVGLILGFIAAFANTKKKKAEKTAPAEEVTKAAEPEETVTETPVETEPADEQINEMPVEETAEVTEEAVAEEVPAEDIPSEEEAVEEPAFEEAPAEYEEPAVEEAYAEPQEEPQPEEPAFEETGEEYQEPAFEEIKEAEIEAPEETFEEVTEAPAEETRAFIPVIEEPAESVSAEVPPVVIVSPLGPRNTRKVETIEEQVDDEELEEAIRDTEEPTLFDMIDEVDETVERLEQSEEQAEELPEEPQQREVSDEYEAMPMLEKQDLSDTQESFIHDSRVSYMNEEGKPQFVITQNIEKVVDIPEEEKKPNFEGYDVRAEKMARVSSFINKVLTAILIAALLFGIYWLYTKYFS